MRIAVVDVAAERSGALSVLEDFAAAVLEENNMEHEWYFITSVTEIRKGRNMHCIKVPYVKRSWLHRLWWEYMEFGELAKRLEIDVVFSLQNNALPVKKLRQIVYFHNVILLPLPCGCRFSFLDKTEWKYAFYNRILAPYIRHTWKKADALIVQGDSVKKQVSRFFSQKRIYVCTPKIKIEPVKSNYGKIKGFIYPTTAYTYKNLELLVEAVKILEQTGTNVEVLVTVSGNENTYAKKIACMAKQTKGIRLIGYQSRQFILEKYQEYGLVITSKLESCPIPIMETAKSQSVIVALDKPYVWDQMRSMKYNRLYVAQDSAEGFATVMREALKDRNEGNYHTDNDETGGMRKVVRLVERVGIV